VAVVEHWLILLSSAAQRFRAVGGGLAEAVSVTVFLRSRSRWPKAALVK
jgi:hypothetical protein